MQDPSAEKSDFLKTGPILVGIVLNWWLWGILVMQYIIYRNGSQSRKDPRLLRVVVHLLFLIDTVQSILVLADGFRWFVYNFGNYEAMVEFGFTSVDGPILDSTIAFVVQLVYCWRIWVLTGWRVLPAFIVFCSFTGFVCGLVTGIYSAVIRTSMRIESQWCAPTLLWYGAGIVTDVLIAVSVTYLFYKLRSERISRGLFVAFRRLSVITLEANILTTIVAIVTPAAVCIKSLRPPSTEVYITGAYVLGKLYSNCFMVLLNQRVYYPVPQTNQTNVRPIESSANAEMSEVCLDSEMGRSTGNVGQASTISFAEPPGGSQIEHKFEFRVEQC